MGPRSVCGNPKAGHILEHTRSLVWEVQPNEFAALLRELELICRWQPRFNVQGRPGRRRHNYVCIGRRPAPYAFLAPRPPATAFACFGPIPAGHRAREVVRRVNDWFQLRDCPQSQEMVFADESELFPEVMFADLFPSRRGRPSVPAEVMASVITLQALHGLSDNETVDAVTFDLRWKAACGRRSPRGRFIRRR